MALKEEQIVQIFKQIENEKFNNIELKVYNNSKTKRIAIKFNDKVLGEINGSKGNVDLYLKAMTVIKTEGFKTTYESFEYKEAPRYDNPFIFRNVSDIVACLHLIDGHALDIAKEMISTSMEQRVAALSIVQNNND